VNVMCRHALVFAIVPFNEVGVNKGGDRRPIWEINKIERLSRAHARRHVDLRDVVWDDTVYGENEFMKTKRQRMTG
jgi:hypothetical protein